VINVVVMVLLLFPLTNYFETVTYYLSLEFTIEIQF